MMRGRLPSLAGALIAIICVTATGIDADSRLAVQSASMRFNRTDGVIQFWQWKVSRDPADFFNYDRLGGAYIQKARETGDISDYALAEDALKKSLSLESKDREAVTALVHMATVLFGEHRFPEAIEFAHRAQALKTGDVSQYAIIGDCQLEMGEYRQAADSFAILRSAAATPEHSGPRIEYLAQSRFAALDFVEGRSERSLAELKQAITTAKEVNAAPENIAWTEFMLGEEQFLGGKISAAKTSYRESLKSYPGYHRALAGLAKVEAANHRYESAADSYSEAIARIPLPIYAAAAGDVYTKMGRQDDARKQFELVEYIARLNALNQTVYNRELALFYADHDLKLGDAVALARKELVVRRDVYSWDVLAWALYKNREVKAAAEADAHALALRTEDPLLFFHAGMIQRGLGNDQVAAKYFRHAMDLNPEFHVLYAEVAERILRDLATTSGNSQTRAAAMARLYQREHSRDAH